MARIKQITSLKAKIRKLNADTIIGLFAVFWLILIFIGVFLLPNNVFAIMIEDFDSYSIETLLETGTGNWEALTIPMRVHDAQYYSSPFSGGDTLIASQRSELTLTEYNIQELRFKVYVDTCNYSWPYGHIEFNFRDSEYVFFAGYIIVNQGGGVCKVFGKKAPATYENIGDIDFDTWNTFIFQQSVIETVSYVRYSINDGVDFTDWLPIHNGIVRNIDKFEMRDNAEQDLFYIDDIFAPSVCQIGSCNICQTYSACEASGCFWWYSIYQPGGLWGGETGGWCIEPYEPDPEECGALFKCQFCMSQATCEAEYCEWVDRYGDGEKCYIPEPEIPLPQTGWEVPDLEDCAPLGGVEKWLCEIKNFASGIFMPSQEKINSLYYTMGSFKDRFPFSYAESLNRFFSEIKTSFDEEKGIPIEILGNESEVDFAFWDNTTIIGEQEESLKNIIFDFTSFVIIFAWFLWLISLIKRFL